MTCSSCRKPNQELIECSNCGRTSCDACWGGGVSILSIIGSIFSPFKGFVRKCPYCGSLKGYKVRGGSYSNSEKTLSNY